MNPQYIKILDSMTEEHEYHCPSCEHTDIETLEVEHKFPYGEGEHAIELTAIVPLRRCRKCGFKFLDDEAEDKQHEAVCHHLGVMTPPEIQALRLKVGSLSRGEFAKITKLGEATIGRWERGELIQNAAYDQLLYLLTFPENLTRLRNRIEQSSSAKDTAFSQVPAPVFRTLNITPSLLGQAESFTLAYVGKI
jgi:putative zinc finger/helix-turn-helix YgiT family protein